MVLTDFSDKHDTFFMNDVIIFFKQTNTRTTSYMLPSGKALCCSVCVHWTEEMSVPD